MQANKNIQNMPPKFYCEKCHYGCCKKSTWGQHLLTAKHSKANFELMQANKEYVCEKCTIKFKHQSSYCRHKKKCQETNIEIHKDEVIDKELIVLLLKQHTTLMEQNNELLEVIKNGTNNTTNSHNTNSLNKTFNLQFFLHLLTFQTPIFTA